MTDDLANAIRRRAYFIWEAENRPQDKHLEHWLRAQAEIEVERSQGTGQPDNPPSVQRNQTNAEIAGANLKSSGKMKRVPS